MADETLDEYEPAPENTIRFHDLKSNYFRVIHVDGAYGGITARGYIHATLYNERRSVPRVTEVKYSGRLKQGPERIVKGRQHVVRELEADLIFDLQSAIEFHGWLARKIKELRPCLKFSCLVHAFEAHGGHEERGEDGDVA